MSVMGTSQTVSADDFNERAKKVIAGKDPLGEAARRAADEKQNKQVARWKRSKPDANANT
jgi:hypothetical protein